MQMALSVTLGEVTKPWCYWPKSDGTPVLFDVLSPIEAKRDETPQWCGWKERWEMMLRVGLTTMIIWLHSAELTRA